MLWNAYSGIHATPPAISVISAGHIFAKRGRRIDRPDGRRDYLLFYVARGAERFALSGKLRDATEGSFVIYAPGEPQIHSTEYDGTSEFYFVHFDLSGELSELGLESSRIYKAEASASTAEHFEAIINELQLKSELFGVVSAVKLTELLCLLKRRCGSERTKPQDEHGKIAYAVQYIHANYSSDEDLSALAAKCGMSKFHFLRRFSEVTGSSPIAYRNKLRLSHAKEMLEDMSLSVAEIADDVGYSSAAYFSDAFKREFGYSPIAARKKR